MPPSPPPYDDTAISMGNEVTNDTDILTIIKEYNVEIMYQCNNVLYKSNCCKHVCPDLVISGARYLC